MIFTPKHLLTPPERLLEPEIIAGKIKKDKAGKERQDTKMDMMLKLEQRKILEELTERYPELEAVRTPILEAYQLLENC